MNKIRFWWLRLKLRIRFAIAMADAYYFGVPDDGKTAAQKANDIEIAINEIEKAHPEDHDILQTFRDVVKAYRSSK
jgi:hypothetical protein